jgi:hypothetical protein
MSRIQGRIVRVSRDELPDGALVMTDSERWLVIVGDHQMTADACAAVNAAIDAAVDARACALAI